MASLITSITCIITYWVYENTCLRDAIHKVGNLAIDKFATIAKMILNNKDTKAIETEIKKATSELKATAKAELKLARKKNNKNDKEWENL